MVPSRAYHNALHKIDFQEMFDKCYIKENLVNVDMSQIMSSEHYYPTGNVHP